MAEADQQSSPNKDNENRRNLNQAKRGDQNAPAENEPEPSPEAQRAKQIGQEGTPMQGVSESAGLTGGSAGGGAWPQPPEQPGYGQGGQEAGGGLGQKAASAGQTAGTAMQAGGQGMKYAGKATKYAGEAAGGIAGGAVGGAVGAIGGVLGGPEGIAAGARAGAKAGSKIGGKVGKVPGQAVEKAGQGIEKAGKKTKELSRKLKEKKRKERKLQSKGQVGGAADKVKTFVTARLLQSAWLSQLSIAGLVTAFWGFFWWLYMIIHFLAAYFTPFSDYFCKFGHEWTSMTAIPATLANRAAKEAGVPAALINQAKKISNKQLELAEISLFIFLSILYILIIFLLAAVIGTVIYAWTHKWDAVQAIGYLKTLKLIWGKIIGKY